MRTVASLPQSHPPQRVSTALPQVVLITHGRFHSFDLAEQLQLASLLQAIYTPYPKFKLRNTHVDPDLIRTFPYVSGLQRMIDSQPVPAIVKHKLQLYAGEAIDFYAKLTRPRCNIVMALSSSGLATGRAVQRHGGRYVCDRGSTHIRYQKQLLAEEYDRVGIPFKPVHRQIIEREECEYATADAVTIPSSFALRSFIESGVSPSKLHMIPYGVDLRAFRPVAPRDPAFRVLFVGQLTARKGIGYLVKAFRIAALPGAKLVFVGSPGTETRALLGNDSLDDLEFTGALTRDEVAVQMSLASVMVLPSIEEGLALVQSQALACGCPIIATTNSGAEDLFEHGKEGFIVPIRDPLSIASALTQLYEDKDLLRAMSQAALLRIAQTGGWDRYGARIIALFKALLGEIPIEDSFAGV